MRRSVGLMICLVVILAASAAYAATAPRIGIAWTPNDYISLCQTGVGLLDTARIGVDAYDSTHYTTWIDFGHPDYINAAFRRDNGVDQWDGESGWYGDQALPIPSGGSSIVVKGLYVWAGQSFAYDTFKIGYSDPGFAHPEEWGRKLRLVKVPDGINYTGAREWTIPLYTNKVGGAFLPDAVLPAYKTDDPFTGYQFEIEIQHVVPEPSSILALFGGIAGLGGFALRRKLR